MSESLQQESSMPDISPPLPSPARKGPAFWQVTPKGLDRIEQFLTLDNGRLVGRLWVFLLRHAGKNNALVVSQATLAEHLNCDARSIRRAVAALRKAKAIVVLKLGSSSCFVLDPQEVWSSSVAHKTFCSFSAETLVGFSENAGLRAMLAHFVSSPSETSEVV
jgi:hypothetical protein